MKNPRTQLNSNIIVESIKAFGDVPVSYDTLIDLTTFNSTYVFTHMLIINSLDEDVTIKFGNNTITIQALKDIWFDNLIYDGIIQYKYKSSAPTVGSIQVICY